MNLPALFIGLFALVLGAGSAFLAYHDAIPRNSIDVKLPASKEKRRQRTFAVGVFAMLLGVVMIFLGIFA